MHNALSMPGGNSIAGRKQQPQAFLRRQVATVAKRDERLRV